MNILSLFDGISCGKVALERAGIPVTNYFASEIDKFAIIISDKNHPDIIRIGDVRYIDYNALPKIDILMGGSPCQNFSFAGSRKGMITKSNIEITSYEQYMNHKKDGFVFDGQLYLFWEFIHALKTVKPKYFFLENVLMKKKWSEIISNELGVEPMMINSSFVSAQNRKRLYWFNWGSEQPSDKNIFLYDIIEDGLVDREKSFCIDASYYKGGNLKQYFEKSRRQLVFNSDIDTERFFNKKPRSPTQNIVIRNIKFLKEKSKCITTDDKISIRSLTPIECERLQTLPDNYTNGVSKTQRYKSIGNGWTVDVISHIFKSINERN